MIVNAVLSLAILFAAPQHESHQMPQSSQKPRAPQMDHSSMPGMQHDMPGMDMNMDGNIGSASQMLMAQASGTSLNPMSAPMHMLEKTAGSWNRMFHGLAYLTDVQQRGPRGRDKLFSTNWAMGMASRSVGKGTLMLRSMISLDPATVTKRRYPELFQTGEEAFGKPIVDGQHPHDLFMEISAQYVQQLGERTNFGFYAAPVGDPALGPVAFPHRISALEIPQATLAHHLQDSTHIANEVVTAGVTHRGVRWEASAFHGTEPNENRWNIDYGAINSWSSRLVIAPTQNWMGQVSVGRLERPEAREENDIVRSTASITYNKPSDNGNWATSVIWGRNHKTVDLRNLNSYLVESAYQFHRMNYVTGRAELLDKDELFSGDAAHANLQDRIFRIGAYTMGYTRDFTMVSTARTALGANVTLYTVPRALTSSYGSHPAALVMFFKVEPMGNMKH